MKVNQMNLRNTRVNWLNLKYKDKNK
jgi:hypothetical protein